MDSISQGDRQSASGMQGQAQGYEGDDGQRGKDKRKGVSKSFSMS